MDSEGMSLARGLLRNLPFYRLIDSISINPATIQQIKSKSGYVGANNNTTNMATSIPHPNTIPITNEIIILIRNNTNFLHP